MEAVAKSGNETLAAIFESGNVTLDAVKAVSQEVEETRNTVVTTAIKSGQFTRTLVQDLEVKLGLQLDGLSQQMRNSFTSLETNLFSETSMIFNELSNFKDSTAEAINENKCIIQKNAFPQVREIENTIQSYNDEDQKELILNHTSKNYVEFFFTMKVPELLRALKGQSFGVTASGASQSLIEIEMECFNPNEFCTEKYHQTLRSQESKLLRLYYRVREFEKILIQTFPHIESQRSLNELENVIEEDLNNIKQEREKSSCPEFVNNFINGCQSFSTYKNQKFDLTKMCHYQDTSPVCFKILPLGKCFINSLNIHSAFEMCKGTIFG